ncbi:MAG: hypothetical protein Q7R97_00840 [Candidatus Daviesbacteria bacterium]|nr:hypothetical protein [Candidatus Daviesbacteria bacterium]
MSNLERKSTRISFEGERGTGKSTLAQIFLINQEILGRKAIINRQVDTGKSTNPSHLKTLELHTEWEKLITDGEESDRVESIAMTKFHYALKWFIQEENIFTTIRESCNTFICDRDIDSIVLYAAVEMIISNSRKYQTNESRINLIKSLWETTKSVKELPDITFCFTSKDHELTLKRSYLSKELTQDEFDLNPIQRASQELASILLSDVVKTRPIEEGKKIYMINIDGKRFDEVARVVDILYSKPYSLIKKEIDYPILSIRSADSKKLIPKSLADLITALVESTSGSAFPSKEDVSLGFSNCVFSNASLVYWAQELKLSNLIFTSVEEDGITNTNPVHWVTFEVLDDEVGRVIDITPFNPPIIGSNVRFKQNNDVIQIAEPFDGTRLNWRQLRIDNPRIAIELMELANLSQLIQPDYVINHAYKMYMSGDREGHIVFAGVRLVRMLEKYNKMDEIYKYIKEMVASFPDNLVVIREITRLNKEYDLELDEFTGTIKRARNRIVNAINIMDNLNARKFKDYYKWVIEN